MNTPLTPTPTEIYDILIVGGGPVGLFAAYYAGLRRMRTKIVDSLEELGGQLTTLYPEKYIFDVAGFPKIYARDLARNLIEQAMQYEPTLALGETVQQLEPRPDLGAYCVTSDRGCHFARTILLSAGAGAFQPKKLPLPETDPWVGRGVYYCVKRRADFAGRRVVIVGGGDSAVDWALNLRAEAAQVTLVHRRNQFRAHEESVRQLLKSGSAVWTFWELKGLETADNRIVGVRLVNNQTQEERSLAADAVLVQVGFVSSLGPLKHWPVQIAGSAIVVDSHMQTTLPGVFAAGDVATYDGKLKLIATGFGEAAVAVNYAKTLLDPKAKFFPGHSSELVEQPAVRI